MTEHKIGEVFLDTENFKESKKVKCVKEKVKKGYYVKCFKCAYDGSGACITCLPVQREDNTGVYFIETTEPLTTEKL